MFRGPGSDLLVEQSCAGSCKRAERLDDAKITELAAAVPAWRLSESRDRLTRTFAARNFTAAINFFNKVAAVAEAEGHHPDLHLTKLKEVEVVLFTHTLGALSIGDFVLAAKIDRLEVDYDPKWLREQQQQQQQQG